jgi:hypothetical protein
MAISFVRFPLSPVYPRRRRSSADDLAPALTLANGWH